MGKIKSELSKKDNEKKQEAKKIAEKKEFFDTATDIKIENVRNWWINSRIVVRRLINKKQWRRFFTVLKYSRVQQTVLERSVLSTKSSMLYLRPACCT